MPARPWFPFYPSDWRGDANLRACSPVARALWMEMLCLMAMAEPYGYLLVAARPLTDEALARQSGMTPEEVRAGLAELEAAAVFSRDEKGTIYSRRMVHQEEVRLRRAAGGVRSLLHPNVPRPRSERAETPVSATRDTSQDTRKDATEDDLQGPPQIPDTRYQKPDTREEPSAPAAQRRGRPTWLTPFCNAWTAAYGGDPLGGELARFLHPLVEQHGAATVEGAWQRYLAETGAQYASAARFAKTFGTWAGTNGRRGKLTQRECNEAVLRELFEEEEARGE